MLNNFKKFFAFPAEDRREIFARAGKQLQTSDSYIEKDIWVCLTLELLFNHRHPSDPHLLFKGGTSLSKVYDAIARFSEDIDITVFPQDIGMDIAGVAALGAKQKKRFLEELSAKCAAYLFGPLVETLQSKFREAGAPDVEITTADEHTLFIQYPSLFAGEQADYVRPKVKIESGARSAVVPNTVATVRPYTQSVLDLGLAVRNVCAIRAERTFCDKVIILHGLRSGHENSGRIPQEEHRVARHYYDLAMLKDTEMGGHALRDRELQESARSHAALMFPSSWRGYDTARPGHYALAPRGELLKVVESDYRAMRDMIFGQVPEFGQIMSAIQEIEHLLNNSDPAEMETSSPSP